MGQAKRRGTFEERKAQAIDKRQLSALADLIRSMEVKP